MSAVPTVVLIFGLVFGFLSLGYVAYAMWRLSQFKALVPQPGVTALPPVTILKPVCGLDTGLYENLRSFCEQDYPQYQIVFGVRETSDPAVAVVRRLMKEYPHRDLGLVVNATVIGSNYKVSNLANMTHAARHDILVIADSDMKVEKNYLRALAIEFADPGVGAVTCLYRGVAAGGLASRLSAMAINEWFLPSVLVALRFRKLDFCFGSTMAVRREALAATGGFAPLASLLADDHMLGKRISGAGYKVVLCPYIVDNIVSEPDFKSAFRHELRWARTILSLEPVGYACSAITYAVPVTLFCAVLSTWAGRLETSAWGLAGAAVCLRMLMHFIARWRLHIREPATPWLSPVRDLLGFFVWAMSFLGRGVSWRGRRFSIDKGGQLFSQQGV
ncbi:MAG TPA: bacteriohopanetetrol glucosamine biosynthesis glycosyltransferase HpnI [Gammaproteobacteria bacterium]|nr:bacteriohopanetetrol glucosamine biosynthesis glycosyltransferase HpnI [Gammaproteobacteria bacterium]